MNDELREVLNLLRLPARLDATQVATILGFADHDIVVLIGKKYLKPLGKPVPNARKYFASVDIQKLVNNRAWLDKATKAVSEHWKAKNEKVTVEMQEAA